MQWFEWIHTRAYSKDCFGAIVAQLNETAPLLKGENLSGVALAVNTELETDVAVTITWNGAEPPRGGSLLARELTALLSPYGSCHKTVWKNL